jgi:peptide methionine sulfoxide reductase MsrA
LEIFFTIHDPTSLNRQGADVGTQYRSAIFYHSEEQKETAEKLIGELNKEGIWDKPIVTSVEPLREFYWLKPTIKTTTRSTRKSSTAKSSSHLKLPSCSTVSSIKSRCHYDYREISVKQR